MAGSPAVIDANPIAIREIKDISEMRVVEDLQKQVWGCNDLDVFPSMRDTRSRGGVCGCFRWRRNGGGLFGVPEWKTVVRFGFRLGGGENGTDLIGWLQNKTRERERDLAKGIAGSPGVLTRSNR